MQTFLVLVRPDMLQTSAEGCVRERHPPSPLGVRHDQRRIHEGLLRLSKPKLHEPRNGAPNGIGVAWGHVIWTGRQKCFWGHLACQVPAVSVANHEQEPLVIESSIQRSRTFIEHVQASTALAHLRWVFVSTVPRTLTVRGSSQVSPTPRSRSGAVRGSSGKWLSKSWRRL